MDVRDERVHNEMQDRFDTGSFGQCERGPRVKARELEKLGYPKGPILSLARAAAGSARMAGRRKSAVKGTLRRLLLDPERFKGDDLFGKLATALIASGRVPKPPAGSYTGDYDRHEPLEYKV